jgi:DNA polymerase III gamma/tau subunit
MQQNNILLNHPAHLWIGDANALKQELIIKLQHIFCKDHACTKCAICQQISTEQFYQTVWINPQDSYSLDDIDAILEQVRFKLDAGQHKFFIFCKAEELSSACSNRLLKTIEEPHAGYHFIFLSTRTETILPTVMSRCLVQEFNFQSNRTEYQEILDIFIQEKLDNPIYFLKLIDKFEIDTQSSTDLVDQLFRHYHYKLKQLHIEKNHDIKILHKYLDLLLVLKKQFNQLPASGSTKIFWKNLFTEFHFTTTSI